MAAFAAFASPTRRPLLALAVVVASNSVFNEAASVSASSVLMGATPSSRPSVATPTRLRASSALLESDSGGSHDSAEINAQSDSRRLSEMGDVLQDLQQDESRERIESKDMDKQIVSLVRKRDAVRRDEARKEREVSFLHNEIDRLERRLKRKSSVVMNSSETQAISSAQAQDALDVAASHSNQDVSAKEIAEAEAAAAEADKVIVTGAESASANFRTNEVATTRAVVASARVPVQATTPETQSAVVRSERRQQRSGQDDADSTDDSFKQFMKEEDGEDQIGDEAYEDSANALAGAIGWNRHDVEKNADSAVKQLTEAIGGKQVVRSVQGMMAGIR